MQITVLSMLQGMEHVWCMRATGRPNPCKSSRTSLSMSPGLKHMSGKTAPVASHNKPVSTAQSAAVSVGTTAHGW